MKNIENLKQQLKNEDDCWILYNEESSDFVFEKFISGLTMAPAIMLVKRDEAILVVCELDVDNVRDLKGIKFLTYKVKNYVFDTFSNALRELNHPKNLLFNYSIMNNAKTDILGAGLYKTMVSTVKKVYKEANKNVKIDSAEKLIYALYDAKEELTINRLKTAAKMADDILKDTFKNIKAGLTEIEIANLTHSNCEELKPEGEIVKINYAWNKNNCPIVLIGDNLVKGGHAVPSTTKIKKGDTVYFDFGVELTFKDGEKVVSDIQRMGYFLKDDEQVAPTEVQKVFDTLVVAIKKGAKHLKPNVAGWKIDKVVRDVILKNGYSSYNHSTGHAVGETCHDIGTALASKGRVEADLRVVLNGTYTIEPRIAIKNGGSIEEMVCVRENGGEFISPRQTKLYLIKD